MTGQPSFLCLPLISLLQQVYDTTAFGIQIQRKNLPICGRPGDASYTSCRTNTLKPMTNLASLIVPFPTSPKSTPGPRQRNIANVTLINVPSTTQFHMPKNLFPCSSSFPLLFSNYNQNRRLKLPHGQTILWFTFPQPSTNPNSSPTSPIGISSTTKSRKIPCFYHSLAYFQTTPVHFPQSSLNPNSSFMAFALFPS